MLSSRTSRRSLRIDVRFLVGVLLVVASIAGVWWVVQSARVSHPVLAAASAIVPGQSITAAQVVEIDAQLGDASDGYLPPDALEEGLVASRVIPEGELIAVSATADAGETGTASVVVESALDLPGGVHAGALVELWAAPLASPGVYDEPIVIVPDAVVAEVLSDDGMMAAQGARVELVVDRGVVPEVLRHASSGSALSTVPVSVAAEGDAR